MIRACGSSAYLLRSADAFCFYFPALLPSGGALLLLLVSAAARRAAATTRAAGPHVVARARARVVQADEEVR